MPTSDVGTDIYWRIFIYTDFNNTPEYALTVIWHALQAISEIFISGMSIRPFDEEPYCTNPT